MRAFSGISKICKLLQFLKLAGIFPSKLFYEKERRNDWVRLPTEFDLTIYFQLKLLNLIKFNSLQNLTRKKEVLKILKVLNLKEYWDVNYWFIFHINLYKWLSCLYIKMTNQFDITIESIIFTFILLYVSEWDSQQRSVEVFSVFPQKKGWIQWKDLLSCPKLSW